MVVASVFDCSFRGIKSFNSFFSLFFPAQLVSAQKWSALFPLRKFYSVANSNVLLGMFG